MEYFPDPSRRVVADDKSGRVRLGPVPDGTLVLPLGGDGQLSVRSGGRRKRLRLDEEREAMTRATTIATQIHPGTSPKTD